MSIPTPVHIKDNPIMQIMFVGAVNFAWDNAHIREQFEKETGMNLKSKTPLDRMIDEATGYEAKYAASFIDWVTVNLWGEEDQP